MEASKRGLELACSHGQHVLDKYDLGHPTHTATGNMLGQA